MTDLCYVTHDLPVCGVTHDWPVLCYTWFTCVCCNTWLTCVWCNTWLTCVAGGEEGGAAVPTSDGGVQSPGQVPHFAHQGLVQGLGVPPEDSSTQGHPVPQLPGAYLAMIFLHTLRLCPPHTLLLCMHSVNSSIPLIAIHPLLWPPNRSQACLVCLSCL